MARTRRPWLWVLLPLLPTACGAEPPPPPTVAVVAPKAVAAVAAVAAPKEPAARWVRSDGATRIGPTSPAGTLALVGGRRVLVRPDGTLAHPEVEAPEPFLHVSTVPTARGEVWVASSVRGVYRLEGALGPASLLARLDVDIERLGAAPGLVAVWDVAGGEPRFIDVVSGAPAPGPALPLAARDLLFSSSKEGAAIFVGAGLAVTNDGGAHFRPATSTGDESVRVAGLRRRGDGLAAFVYEDGLEGPIDAATATLGAMVEPPKAKEEAPLLRWIRGTSRDPLEAAVSGGVRDGAGHALVASHGLVARVDLATGALLELVGLGPAPTGTRCGSGRRGDMALFACSLPPEEEGDLYDPFGVVMVPLDGRLAPARPVVARNAETEMRVGSGGGVMLLGACSADEEGDACVRQPDGKWKTLTVGQDLFERGAGPLVDGRVAFVRGLFEGDEPEVPAEGAPRADLGYPSPYVVAVDGSGTERWLAGSQWEGRTSGPLAMLSPVNEGPDGALHFALTNDEGAFVFALPSGRTVPPIRVEGARDVRIAGEHAVAVGPQRFALSDDGGHTFHEPARAPSLLDEAERVAASGDPNELAVSDVGLRLGSWLRIGWSLEGDAPSSAAPPSDASLPARAVPSARGQLQVLSCKKAAKQAQSTAFVPLADELVKILGPERPAPKGTRRQTAPLAAGRGVDASALLVEEGPDTKDGKPARWTLAWLDPMEVGGAIHRFSAAPPEGAAWGTQLRNVEVRGPRALATVRSGGKSFLMRAGMATKPAFTQVDTGELPQGDVVFGEGAGEPIFWSRTGGITAFFGDEAPLPFLALAAGGGRVLGEPTAAGLPLMLASGEWSRMRLLDLPKKPVDRARRPPSLPLEAWGPAPNFRRDLGRFPACGARPTGTRFFVPQSYVDLELDGQKRTVRALVLLRVQGEDACVESVAGLSTASAKQGALFVRADLAKKKAEATQDGAPREHSRLDCTLVPKR